MALNYTAEKLHIAAGVLARAPGSVRERLVSAWLPVSALNPTAEDFTTEDLRARFQTLITEMTATPAVGNEGSVQATLDHASDDDVQRWAEELFEIYHDVTVIHARSTKQSAEGDDDED